MHFRFLFIRLNSSCILTSELLAHSEQSGIWTMFLSLVSISGSTATSFSSALCTKYSDLVAINVYKLVLLLLK